MLGFPAIVLGSPNTRAAGLAGCTALLALSVAASLAIGSRSVPFGEVVDAFTAYDGSDGHAIVRELRVPRTELGLLVGAALGAAGALMQGATRNALAEPGIMGINAGAAFAVVLAINWLGVGSVAAWAGFALVGAGVTAVAVLALGATGRNSSAVSLALAGSVLAALLLSLTSAVLVFDAQTLDEFRQWVVGSIAGREAGVAISVAPIIAAGLVIALGAGRSLNALALGDDVARSLGQHVARARILATVGFVLLAGGAVAAAGPIAFVGLAVPHIARVFTGPDYRWVIPYSVVLGAVLLLASDVLGRVVARPADLGVGHRDGAPRCPVLHLARAAAKARGAVTRRGRLDLRVVSVLAALTAAALAAMIAGVALGEFSIPPLDVVETLVGAGDRATNFIVLDLRLPRALTGLLVGAALGIAGAVFQEVTRNPLAAPDIVGVSGGASLAAVTLVVFGSGSGLSVPFVALAGALIAGAGLYAFAWRRGIHGARLVLIGIGVAAFAHAGITYVLAKGRIFEVAQAFVWLVGSLNGRGWSHVWPLAATLAVLAPVLYALGRRADVLALGDDVARALGLGVERTRLGDARAGGRP